MKYGNQFIRALFNLTYYLKK